MADLSSVSTTMSSYASSFSSNAGSFYQSAKVTVAAGYETAKVKIVAGIKALPSSAEIAARVKSAWASTQPARAQLATILLTPKAGLVFTLIAGFALMHYANTQNDPDQEYQKFAANALTAVCFVVAGLFVATIFPIPV